MSEILASAKRVKIDSIIIINSARWITITYFSVNNLKHLIQTFCCLSPCLLTIAECEQQSLQKALPQFGHPYCKREISKH